NAHDEVRLGRARVSHDQLERARERRVVLRPTHQRRGSAEVHRLDPPASGAGESRETEVLVLAAAEHDLERLAEAEVSPDAEQRHVLHGGGLRGIVLEQIAHLAREEGIGEEAAAARRLEHAEPELHGHLELALSTATVDVEEPRAIDPTALLGLGL